MSPCAACSVSQEKNGDKFSGNFEPTLLNPMNEEVGLHFLLARVRSQVKALSLCNFMLLHTVLMTLEKVVQAYIMSYLDVCNCFCFSICL